MTGGPRRALVTGCSRGIGRAIAERLLDDGWVVHGTYLSGAAQAQALADAHPGLSVHRADLRDDAAVGALLEAIGPAPLAALVNNAGVVHFEAIEDFDLGNWRETLEVNLTAPVRLACALEPHMHGGAIVNVASTDGLIGSYATLAYGASKAALLNVTKSLANVLARSGIRVNAVTRRRGVAAERGGKLRDRGEHRRRRRVLERRRRHETGGRAGVIGARWH
jgi:NAD(P)-dependent dehydrogenase (short-subunit alcohol dehydrogenase family)